MGDRHVGIAEHFPVTNDDASAQATAWLVTQLPRWLPIVLLVVLIALGARWRGLRAPRATALERRLGSRGGYCDCEIFMNGWTASRAITTYDFETDDEVWPNPMPTCSGVRARSTQPCPLWTQTARRGGRR